MTTSIEKLRVLADFAEKHDLAEHLSSAYSLNRPGLDVQLYEEAHESAIEALLRWADALGASVVHVRDVEPNLHLHIYAELPGIEGRFGVVAVTREAETAAVTEAAVVSGHETAVPVDVMRTLIRSSEDGAE